MDNKQINSLQTIENKNLFKKLLLSKPDSNYENLFSIIMNLNQLDIENEALLKSKLNLRKIFKSIKSLN